MPAPKRVEPKGIRADKNGIKHAFTYHKKTESLCWYCGNTKCSWHLDLEPVDGWKIDKTKISLEVRKCPEFLPIPDSEGKRFYQLVWRDIDKAFEVKHLVYKKITINTKKYDLLKSYLESIEIYDMEDHFGCEVIRAIVAGDIYFE